MNIRQTLKVVRAFVGPARPIMLYHKPTSRCDCRCHFCDFWVKASDDEEILSTELVMVMLDQARQAGMTHYILWGGEPLLLEDLPVWQAYARRAGFYVSLCTSGYRLPERAAEIVPQTDRLLVSLECADDRQDEIRRTPGLFRNIVAGLEKVKTCSSTTTVLWCNVSKLNLDCVSEVARFALEYKIGVEFFPMAHFSQYNQQYLLDAGERRTVFDQILALKRSGYPVRNTRFALELMASSRPFRCQTARLSVQVMPEGSIYACEPRINPDLKPYGSIPNYSLERLAVDPVYQAACLKMARCNRCLLPCVANVADNLRLQPFYWFFDRFLTGLSTMVRSRQ
ncbi:radical SAM protein [bacterium]|nr:radical SAM protein [bacterium]